MSQDGELGEWIDGTRLDSAGNIIQDFVPKRPLSIADIKASHAWYEQNKEEIENHHAIGNAWRSPCKYCGSRPPISGHHWCEECRAVFQPKFIEDAEAFNKIMGLQLSE